MNILPITTQSQANQIEIGNIPILVLGLIASVYNNQPHSGYKKPGLFAGINPSAGLYVNGYSWFVSDTTQPFGGVPHVRGCFVIRQKGYVGEGGERTVTFHPYEALLDCQLLCVGEVREG
jgi:hypothetical protein